THGVRSSEGGILSETDYSSPAARGQAVCFSRDRAVSCGGTELERGITVCGGSFPARKGCVRGAETNNPQGLTTKHLAAKSCVYASWRHHQTPSPEEETALPPGSPGWTSVRPDAIDPGSEDDPFSPRWRREALR